MLRSCYAAECRFYYDRPDVLTEIQWYFVPNDSQTVPYPSPFVSRIYDREDEIEPLLGETYSPVPWRGGLPPRAVSSGGLCGTADEWFRGVVYPFATRPVYPGTFIPTCCQAPVEMVIGGLIASGEVANPNCCRATWPATGLNLHFGFGTFTCGFTEHVGYFLDRTVLAPFDSYESSVFSVMGSIDCFWRLTCQSIFPPPSYLLELVDAVTLDVYALGNMFAIICDFVNPGASGINLAIDIPGVCSGNISDYSVSRNAP